MRWIAHVDMDSFYVSVERLRDPSLNGKPVVVGGKGPRSVVASSSYEARKFGVRSAMPMAQARRLCRELVIVEPNFSRYSELSRKVFSELEKIAPVVEQVSVDEAYLDFTGCERLYSSREHSARVVKDAVKRVSGLTATVGVSTNKLVAKIASDFAKPDGLLIVPAGGEEQFLAPMSVRKIPGVGPKTSIILERLGLMTCRELAACEPSKLKTYIGDYGSDLRQAAKGIHEGAVDPEGDRKSFSAEETFDVDIGDMRKLADVIRGMADELATSLREEGFKARTIQIKLRYSDFTTLLRAKTRDEATHLTREISDTAFALLNDHKDPRLKLRLLGVGVRNLVPLELGSSQLDLFEDPQKRLKEEKLEFIKDTLKKKFGNKILKIKD